MHIEKEDPCIPDEILVEILSWLPAKFLLRYKCVCKHWNALIQGPYLIAKHLIRAESKYYDAEHVVETPVNVNESRREIFKYVTDCNGLILLERTRVDHATNCRFRVRNPETHQFLDVPNPITHGKNITRIFLTFVPSTDEYKLVAAYYNQERAEVEGCEILTLGSDDFSWRPIKAPDQWRNNKKKGSKVVAGDLFGAVAFIRLEAKDFEVVTLDLESESFISNMMPDGFFSNMEKIWILPYGQKLALADIVEGKLNILVLEDHKKHKWVEKKIDFPLTFLAEDGRMKGNFCPVAANNKFLCFEKDGERFIYDIECKRTTRIVETKLEGKVALRPSMISFNGMQPENYKPREKEMEDLNPEIQQGSMENKSNCSIG